MIRRHNLQPLDEVENFCFLFYFMGKSKNVIIHEKEPGGNPKYIGHIQNGSRKPTNQ